MQRSPLPPIRWLVRGRLAAAPLGWGLLLAAVACGQSMGTAPAEPRWRQYIAVLEDGTAVSGDAWNWRLPGVAPRLDDRDLLAPPAARALFARAAAWEPASSSWLELHNADQIPGGVAGVDEAAGELCLRWRTPPWLQQPFREPRPLPVRLAWVRRLVIRPAAPAYEPRTVWLSDGRRVEFLGLRWRAAGVSLLTREGRRDLDWEQLAEVHAPSRGSAWEVLEEERRGLAERPDARLVQAEAAGGLRVTAAVDQARPFSPRPNSSDDGWAVALTPVWTAEPVWVRPARVATWRFFAANWTPLTRWLRIAPTRPPGRIGLEQRADGGWLTDSLGQPAAWGWSCRGQAEVVLDAPPLPARLTAGLAWIGESPSAAAAHGEAIWEGGGASPFWSSELLSASGPRQTVLPPTGWPPAATAVRLRVVPADPSQSPETAWIEPAIELGEAEQD